MVKIVVTTLRLNMPYLPQKLHPCDLQENRMRWALGYVPQFQKSSYRPVPTSNSTTRVAYFRRPALFKRWGMSSRLVEEDLATLVCHRHRSSTSEPVLVIGLQRWYSWLPCSASSPSMVFRLNLRGFTSDIFVTVFLRCSALKQARGQKLTCGQQMILTPSPKIVPRCR